MRSVRLSAVLLVAISGCQCGEPLQVLLPTIAIADPEDAIFSLCAQDFVAQCAYDFGPVLEGESRTVSFAIVNTSQTSLSITSVTLEGAPSFALEGTMPKAVAVGSAGEVVTVRYTASAGAESARVIVTSNADNAPRIEIALTATATSIELGGPIIVVTPAQCDFGSVGVGARSLCSVSIENAGQTDLHVTGIAFSPDTPALFEVDVPLATPATIPAGTARTASFAATPPAPGTFTGTLVITSDDASTADVVVPLVVRGNEGAGPTALARLKSVNGIATSDPLVEPLDDVVFSADQSSASAPATIASYAWTLIEKPAESSVTLSAPNGVDTGLVFSSAAGEVSGVDVAGTFRVQLVVTDSFGAVSENEAIVTINAVPTEGVHVQLSWSASSNDLDLHYGKGQNINWCTNMDCYYGNCEGGGPNWDGVAGFTDGDATLDIDDTNGFGPENINVEVPVDDRYVIAVHSYSGEGGGPGFTATDVTVKVFLGGALTNTFTGHLDAKDQFWRVAKVVVTNGVPVVTPIDTVATAFTCE
jgi:hypothetical protein